MKDFLKLFLVITLGYLVIKYVFRLIGLLFPDKGKRGNTHYSYSKHSRGNQNTQEEGFTDYEEIK
jgi:hypothetical protein